MRAAGNTGSLPVWRAETSNLKSALDTLFFFKTPKSSFIVLVFVTCSYSFTRLLCGIPKPSQSALWWTNYMTRLQGVPPGSSFISQSGGFS